MSEDSTGFRHQSESRVSLGSQPPPLGRRAKGLSLLLLFLVVTGRLFAATSEDWKGASPGTHFNLGALGGLAIVDGNAGFGLLGTAAVKILQRGFVPDINDAVYLETQVGPAFFNGWTDVMLGAHLRWDFYRNDDWTFYALGGVMGVFGTGAGNTRNEIFPRFGIGTIWELWPSIALRAELSHELIAVGVSFFF